MKRRFVPAFAAGAMAVGLITSLASCSQANVTNINFKTAEEESENFVSENIPVYKHSNELSDTLTLFARFYNGEHYVPYVPLSYYLEAYDVFELARANFLEGKYNYIYKLNGKKFPIIVDVKNDTITCAEWAGFNEESNGGEEEDAITKKMINSLRTYFGQKTYVYDLKKYGMEIYGGIDDAYVPLCVLNQLFTSRNYEEYFYNGEGIYYFGGENTQFKYTDFNKSFWYMDSEGNVCERPQKLVDLAYNMLAFTHDYCYGHPEYYGFADDGTGYPDVEKVKAADVLCFDDMLTTYAPDVKAMLKSTSYVEYLKGLSKLLWNTYGDSHTGSHFTAYLPEFTKDPYIEWADFYLGPECQAKKGLENNARKTELEKERSQVPGRADSEGEPLPFYLLSSKKTAVFTFDHFAVDIEFWKKYYNSSHVTENPDPANFEIWGLTYSGDPTVDFYKAVYALLNDDTYKDVETLVIDISCNSGGDDRCLKKILAYLLDAPEFKQNDINSDTHYTHHISADLNLDGKIDSKDTELHNSLKAKFKFVVLVSRASFSCGNAFSAICADAGVPVIGERTGGGSCVVSYGCTADGYPYQYSGRLRISHTDWSGVESGKIIISGGEITAAADFYDDAKLQAVIDRVVK